MKSRLGTHAAQVPASALNRRTSSGSSTSESMRTVVMASASGPSCWMIPHGPRRMSAVSSPACTAGRMSLSSRSPT